MLDRPDVSAELVRVPAATRSELVAAGTSDWRLRKLGRVDGLRGVRADSGTEQLAAYTRIAAVAKAIAPNAVIAGWSAAVVLGVPTAFIDGTTNGQDPLLLCVNPRGTQVHRRGVRFNYSKLDDGDVVEVHDLRVTKGVRTAFDCIRLAPGVTRALGWADACYRFGICGPQELAEYAAMFGKSPGIRRVRELVPLLSPFAESPMESAMRYVWVGAGLPTPLVNPSIFDPSGKFIARVDLLDPASGLVGEYNGSWHRDGVQPWKDTKRQRALEAVGATVANLGAPDFGPDLVAVSELRSRYLDARTRGLFSARVVPKRLR